MSPAGDPESLVDRTGLAKLSVAHANEPPALKQNFPKGVVPSSPAALLLFVEGVEPALHRPLQVAWGRRPLQLDVPTLLEHLALQQRPHGR